MSNRDVRIELPYSSFSSGAFSDWIAYFREMEIQHLTDKESERDCASEQQLDADEIADLLDNATGDYGQSYQLIAHEYVKYFDSIVSAKLRLKLKLTPTQLSSDFDDGDAINALAPIDVAQKLLDRSQRKGHTRFRRELGRSERAFGALLKKPIKEWNERELGALLRSFFNVDDVESDVMYKMAEGTECFFASSAIDFAAYNLAARKLRQVPHRRRALVAQTHRDLRPAGSSCPGNAGGRRLQLVGQSNGSGQAAEAPDAKEGA
jgi:hypothetical protein